jgi:toxin ParE1/3/4
MKPLEYRFSPRMRLEFRDILNWLFDERPGREDKFIEAIEKVAHRLCVFPESGVSIQDVMVGFRMVPVWDYLLFYSIQSDHIRLERLIHGARDLRAALEDEVG